MTSPSADAERRRILAELERRKSEIGPEFYALSDAANLYTRHGQERALLAAMDGVGIVPLHQRRILEIGCGGGQWFSMFEAFGASPEQLAGIDLDPTRIEEARAAHPIADVRVGDATDLPWPDATFDLVVQITVFSSILDAGVRNQVAREMLRVTRAGGTILWYDLRYNNPRNRNVRRIGRTELQALFPGSSITLEPVTLLPPLARRVVPHTWLGAALLEKVPFLKSHFVGVIRPLA